MVCCFVLLPVSYIASASLSRLAHYLFPYFAFLHFHFPPLFRHCCSPLLYPSNSSLFFHFCPVVAIYIYCCNAVSILMSASFLAYIGQHRSLALWIQFSGDTLYVLQFWQSSTMAWQPKASSPSLSPQKCGRFSPHCNTFGHVQIDDNYNI